MPDPTAGDPLMCALVFRDGAALAPEEFAAFLGGQQDLSPKAWPRHVRIAEDLPATATNKVLKRTLVQQALDTTDVLWACGERDHAYAVVAVSSPA